MTSTSCTSTQRPVCLLVQDEESISRRHACQHELLGLRGHGSRAVEAALKSAREQPPPDGTRWRSPGRGARFTRVAYPESTSFKNWKCSAGGGNGGGGGGEGGSGGGGGGGGDGCSYSSQRKQVARHTLFNCVKESPGGASDPAAAKTVTITWSQNWSLLLAKMEQGMVPSLGPPRFATYLGGEEVRSWC